MKVETLLLMRHELLLTLIAILILLAGLFRGKQKKSTAILLSTGLFFIHTLIGFLPLETGSLFGGMYQTSPVLILMKNILNIGVFIVLVQSYPWLLKEQNHEKIHEYFLLILSTLLGMNFMISSGNFLIFYIGLELATLPLAALSAYEKLKARSSEAGIKLILSAALSSGIMLYGISLLYATTGTIDFSSMATLITGTHLHILAFIFFFSGLAFKISLVPFHLWTADVYEGAPVNVTSFLSVISKGAAVFILIIVLFLVFRSIADAWKVLLYIIAVLTMSVGNLFAIRQKNLKRFLAFSSIAQAGFILLGMIGSSQFGMASVIYFILIYIFSNLGAFGVVAAISAVSGKENMDDYNGLYKTNPLLSLVMLLSLFSLAGIPPTAGFFGKFFLFAAAAQAGFYWLVFIAVINATISLYYYLLVVKAIFINDNEKPVDYFKSDFPTRLGLLICVAGIIVTGFASIVFETIYSISFGI